MNWTGPSKVLLVGPSSSAADGYPVGDEVVYLEWPVRPSRSTLIPRESGMTCKLCANPHDDSDRPVHLSVGLTAYLLVLPRSHPLPTPLLTIWSLTLGWSILNWKLYVALVRARHGGKLAVMYETRWKRLTRVSWKCEKTFDHFRPVMPLYGFETLSNEVSATTSINVWYPRCRMRTPSCVPKTFHFCWVPT